MQQKTTSNQPDWQQLLAARGILDAALSAGWTSITWCGTEGWSYPLCDEQGIVIGNRFKALPGQKPKCAWPTGKPEGCKYYFTPGSDTRPSIARADGHLYISSGEPDLLTFRSAGIRNVICWFGEGNVPATLLDDLIRLGVRTVSYFPDIDDTGRKSAAKIADILSESEIEFTAYELPASLGEKGDINDLWIDCDFNVDAFRQALSELGHFHNHADGTVPAQTPNSLPTFSDHTTGLPDSFYLAIEQALGVTRYNRNGWSEPICCPFHDDENPSASWNYEMHILKCFTCTPEGRDNYLAIQVGEVLNINWRDYITHRSANLVSHVDLTTLPPSEDSAESSGDATTNDEIEDDEDHSVNSMTQQKKLNITHDVVGDNLMRQWNNNRVHMRGQYYEYVNGYWKSEDHNHIDKLIWDQMKAYKDNDFKPTKGACVSIQHYLEGNLHVPDSEVDNDDGYINLENGLYNLAEFALEDHNPSLYQTTQLPYAFDADAICTRWLSCLDMWFPHDPNMIACLQEAIGYSLTTSTKYEKAFVPYGKAGSGKSTLIRVLEFLLGEACGSLDFNALNRNSYQLAQIPGKRVVTCTEVRSGSSLPDNIFKQLVSGDRTVVRDIYQRPFSFKPRAKIWWAMNELPTNYDRSNAVYRRLVLFPFDHAIADTDKDPNLINELRSEIPGIFNWALEGLKRLQERGEFVQSERSQKVLTEYQHSNDVEALFVEDMLIIGDDKEIQSGILYGAYVAWCEHNGHKPKPSNQMKQQWQRLGLMFKKRSTGNFYLGVGLK